ncbi:MAG TPA: phage head closure protein [Rhizomicrobium sp.]|jgi:SPP1 family predicted phage head-tail adaptor|nr:phage head closure protein [Rhizomicrobium sp.]
MLSTLNRRVALEAQRLTPDGAGGYSASWDVIATVWAAVEPMSGTDVFGPDASEARVKYRVTIRRRTDLFAGMRVNDGGRLFAITTVLDDGPQSQFFTLMTEKIG